MGGVPKALNHEVLVAWDGGSIHWVPIIVKKLLWKALHR
jgi:hypothetical protein